MSQLSVVVLTRNNQESVKKTLQSLTWCKERIVIDDQSTDQTVDIAKKEGATVIVHSLDNNFAAQRNYALQQVKYDWVLFVDSDEVVSKKLAEEIQQAIKQDSIDGYYLKRDDVFLGKQLRFGETAHVQLLRLAKKNKGTWVGIAHETWEINGTTNELQHSLLHYPHPTISDFLADIHRYSTLVAQQRIQQGKTVSWWQIIAYPVGKFIQNYLVRQGYRDGTHGAVMAIMMSFHSFLVKGKMYTMKK